MEDDDIEDLATNLTDRIANAIRAIAHGDTSPGGLEAIAMTLTGERPTFQTLLGDRFRDFTEQVTRIADAFERIADAAENLAPPPPDPKQDPEQDE